MAEVSSNWPQCRPALESQKTILLLESWGNGGLRHTGTATTITDLG